VVRLLVAEHDRHPDDGFARNGYGRPDHRHGADHAHGPEHAHGDHQHPMPELQTVSAAEGPRTVELQQKVLAKNDEIAAENRAWLSERGILAVNLMSSPGAGKTTLLEATMHGLAGRVPISVVEGDQETALDASRILAAGTSVVQVNTGVGCHLDADMVSRALRCLEPASGSIVMIENVGNLVCPALFDLGEAARVVLSCVTEGADKPVKYPQMFRAGELMLVNKIDLLPYVNFDVEQCASYARQVNPRLEILEVSATRGDGLDRWYDWLRHKVGRQPAPSA